MIRSHEVRGKKKEKERKKEKGWKESVY